MPGGFLVGLWFCQGRWGEPWRALFIEVREERAELGFIHSLQTPRRADVRMKDLDADGVPEVRIGRHLPEGGRLVETFRLAGDGFEPWSGELAGPWAAAARAACAEHAEGSPGCDPILDVETSSEPLPGGRAAVVAEGPRAECGMEGCPVSAWLVLADGNVTKILDDFGSIGFGPPRPEKEPPCIFIDGAVSRRYCWDGQAFRHVREDSGSED